MAARAWFDVKLRTVDAGMTVAEAATTLTEFDAVLPTLGDAFLAEAFEAAQQTGIRCKMLANFGVGYNHIDVEAARAHGVMVSNTPGAVTDATADIAMTLILSTCRRTGEGERMVRSGGWRGWAPTQMLGAHVTGKVLGVIGMGRIGQAIAHRCHYGFGMEVVFYNRSAKDVAMPARQLASLEEVAAVADVVVVAVPGGADTAQLVGAPVFAAMKPSAVFVNIARGDVVDEPALIEALQAGEIAGAGLDVYAAEPVVPAALLAMDNVVLLPHLGTNTLEVREAMGAMALDNLIAWSEGQEPPQRLV